jgi:large subunit ribosomal protein L23
MRSITAKKPEVKVGGKKSEIASARKVPKEQKPISLKPRASEKAYALSEKGNTYIFDVEPGINKFDVALAVEAQYGVTVIAVRLAATPGKKVRTYRQKGRRSQPGQRSAVRKAYVTLSEGDKLPIFAAVEEPTAPKETK